MPTDPNPTEFPPPMGEPPDWATPLPVDYGEYCQCGHPMEAHQCVKRVGDKVVDTHDACMFCDCDHFTAAGASGEPPAWMGEVETGDA
jgi:hypothetical protein